MAAAAVGLALAATAASAALITGGKGTTTRPAPYHPDPVAARAAAVTACRHLGDLVDLVAANAPAPQALRAADQAARDATRASELATPWVQLASAAQGVAAALRADDGTLAGLSMRLARPACAGLGAPLPAGG